MNEQTKSTDFHTTEDEPFSYEGYQIVHGEFFSHIFEPAFTFSNYQVYVNAACIRRLPDYDYIQILINPNDKKLVVRPCGEEEKDSFRWCSAAPKRSPKHIRCRIFFAKVLSLMEWSPNHRYKLLGKLIRYEGEVLYIFDLNSPEVYRHTFANGKKLNSSCTPVFPEGWKNQFGLPVTDHKPIIHTNIVKGHAVFGLENKFSEDL